MTPYNLAISFLGIHSTEISIYIYQKALTRMLTALFVIIPKCKLSKMPTNSSLEKKLWCTHPMEHSPAAWMSNIQLHLTIWISHVVNQNKPNTKMHTTWFHLCKIQWQAKGISVVINQNCGSGVGVTGKGLKKGFWSADNIQVFEQDMAYLGMFNLWKFIHLGCGYFSVFVLP